MLERDALAAVAVADTVVLAPPATAAAAAVPKTFVAVCAVAEAEVAVVEAAVPAVSGASRTAEVP